MDARSSFVLPEQLVQGSAKHAADGQAEPYRGIVVAALYGVYGLAGHADGVGQLLLGHVQRRAGGLHAQVFHSPSSSRLTCLRRIKAAANTMMNTAPSARFAPASWSTPSSTMYPSDIAKMPRPMFIAPSMPKVAY